MTQMPIKKHLVAAGLIAAAGVTAMPASNCAAEGFDTLDLKFAQASGPDKAGELPLSRDALFGAAPAAPEDKGTGIKWSGFLNETIAYTYADPKHWSRAVTRLQINGQGQLGAGVKYKISGRVDVDPVYYTSNFYNSDVKSDQRLDFFLRENYLDFAAGDWDFRLGRQQIVWGEMVGLFFADVVSARDLREFILPSFDILRTPQWAARAEYFKNDVHAEFIWIPVQTLDNIGKPGSDFYPAGLLASPPPGATNVFNEVETPARKLSNSSYGVRLNTVAAGWDVSAFYYRSYATSPTFYRQIIAGPTPTFVFSPRHDRIWQTGGTVSKDLSSSVLLKGEVVYTHGQNYGTTSLTAVDGVVRRNVLDSIVGLDFTMPHDMRLNVQGFHRNYFGGDDANLVPESGGFGVSALVSAKIGGAWEPQLLWIQSLSNDGDRLIRPRLNWYFAKNSTLAFGADIFAGPDTGFFGRYANRDRLYTELRYDF